jgi:hypothetical protein
VLLRRHDQRSAHRMRDDDDALQRHAHVIPPAVVVLER